jgi:hypothetical protein
MAASGPARSLLQEIRVIGASNENVSRYFLFLEMAFQTKRRIAFIQQALVDGPVRRMTNGAALPQCLMLIDKWAALLCVTLEARFVSAQESKTAGFKRLLNVCLPTFDCDSLVHLVTIGAAHFAFRNGVMMRQLERGANFQVTLKTGFRRLSWIDNRTSAAAGFHVQTPRPVARFTAHVRDLFWSFAAFCAGLTDDNLFCLEPRMGRCPEIARDLFVTRGAFFRADKLCAGNTGRSENRSVGCAAGKQNDGQRNSSPGRPQQTFAPAEDPSS